MDPEPILFIFVLGSEKNKREIIFENDVLVAFVKIFINEAWLRWVVPVIHPKTRGKLFFFGCPFRSRTLAVRPIPQLTLAAFFHFEQ